MHVADVTAEDDPVVEVRVEELGLSEDDLLAYDQSRCVDARH